MRNLLTPFTLTMFCAVSLFALSFAGRAATADEDRLLLTYPNWEARIVDERVDESRHTDTVFTFPQYRSREEWLRRAAYLRRHVLVSCGLWPLSARTPLKFHIADRHEDDGYSIEKVWFESMPGVYVTGNLLSLIHISEPTRPY